MNDFLLNPEMTRKIIDFLSKPRSIIAVDSKNTFGFFFRKHRCRIDSKVSAFGMTKNNKLPFRVTLPLLLQELSSRNLARDRRINSKIPAFFPSKNRVIRATITDCYSMFIQFDAESTELCLVLIRKFKSKRGPLQRGKTRRL